MIGLGSGGGAGVSAPTLVTSLDASVSVAGTTTPSSITRATSASATEIFIIPANAMSADGMYAEMLVEGRWFNNVGTSQNTAFEVTVGGVLVYGSVSPTMSTNASDRAFRLIARIIRTSASTITTNLDSAFSTPASANGSVSGSPYGSLGGASVGVSLTTGSTFNPAVANTIVVTATHSAASANLIIEPKFRQLRILTVG